MVQQVPTKATSTIIYQDSDGQPMSDNTKQFRWIVIVKENLEILFADVADVFVAGDLLWYPVEGNNKICQAPDVMVAFGRAKGDRGSYQQWEEDNIPPQVVFEILSPGNRLKEMTKKLHFYERYGVEEYYIYDPERIDLVGLQRLGEQLEVIEEINGWISPRLGIKFDLKPDTLAIFSPSGERFLTPVELDKLRQQECQRADEAVAQLQQEQQRYQALLEKLRSHGIDPEQL